MNASAALAGLGLGIALAGAPGPVQAILLAEGVRGGMGRAFRAMAGANFTFAVLLVVAALGLSLARPTGVVLLLLKLSGGAFLVFLAVDGLRSSVPSAEAAPEARRSLPPAARGVVAVVLNPGGWIFLATVAASFFATAEEVGGKGGALAAALAMIVGIALGDLAVVLFGGLGLRRAGARAALWVQRGLALVLAALGVGLLVSAFAR